MGKQTGLDGGRGDIKEKTQASGEERVEKLDMKGVGENRFI